MASFGIEGIRYFANSRASGAVTKAEDLTYVFNVCNGLDDELRAAGHTPPLLLGQSRLLGDRSAQQQP